MPSKKLVKLIALALIAAVTAFTTNSLVPSTSVSSQNFQVNGTLVQNKEMLSTEDLSDFPQRLIECLPDRATKVRRIAVETAISVNGTDKLTYHLFKHERNGEEERAAVLDHGGTFCGLAYYSIYGLQMSEMLPLSVAQSFALQEYRNVIAQLDGGLEELKQGIASLEPSMDGTLPQFSPERIWALAQLGIIPPEDSYTLIEIEPYEPGQFSQ